MHTMKEVREQIHELIWASGLSDADTVTMLNSVCVIYQRRLENRLPSINDIILEAAGAPPRK